MEKRKKSAAMVNLPLMMQEKAAVCSPLRLKKLEGQCERGLLLLLLLSPSIVIVISLKRNLIFLGNSCYPRADYALQKAYSNYQSVCLKSGLGAPYFLSYPRAMRGQSEMASSMEP